MLISNAKRKHIAKFCVRLVVIGACTCLFAPLAGATEKDMKNPDAGAKTKDLVSHSADNFSYQLEGRPDPFMPFIQPKVTKFDMNEIVEDEVTLTGMQLIEPGQLILVGVMESGDKKIAMVEDDTGKGYVINEGTLIGRHGYVSRITADNDVIITETARTRAGKKIVTTIVMRLNKEGDQ